MSTTTTTSVGLRQRRKQETRARLSAVATVAFLERGFDRVTIADVADAAGVSKMTVTNYFPLKEDLVFDRQASIVALPADAVRSRPAGEALASCLHRAYREALAAGDPTMGQKGAPFARMVGASPALRSRAREIVEQRRRALAEAVADEPAFAGDPTGAALAATALAGAFEVLQAEAQRLLLDGEAEPAIVASLEEEAGRLFAAAGAMVEALAGSR